jgi:hypothetical protein
MKMYWLRHFEIDGVLDNAFDRRYGRVTGNKNQFPPGSFVQGKMSPRPFDLESIRLPETCECPGADVTAVAGIEMKLQDESVARAAGDGNVRSLGAGRRQAYVLSGEKAQHLPAHDTQADDGDLTGDGLLVVKTCPDLLHGNVVRPAGLPCLDGHVPVRRAAAKQNRAFALLGIAQGVVVKADAADLALRYPPLALTAAAVAAAEFQGQTASQGRHQQ